MVPKEKENFSIDDYIKDSKETIKAYAILHTFIFLFFLYISFKYNAYFVLPIVLVFIFCSIYSKVDTYLNLKKIKEYLVTNKLLSKIGKIEFWNNSYYFLTENYMIIKQKGIYAFTYSEIKKKYKNMKIKLSKNSNAEEHLYIETKDNVFKILTWTLICVEEDYRDISDYLLKKNPNIIVENKK